ncbi:DUF4157 domain-containing protein [Undibacterium sp. TJN19]|uniref:eCIS core domain-containing protein n=1 Tax=Undibacterium sp. TJN19 TaxID=3413055 RepID=UPI003BF24A1F
MRAALPGQPSKTNAQPQQIAQTVQAVRGDAQAPLLDSRPPSLTQQMQQAYQRHADSSTQAMQLKARQAMMANSPQALQMQARSRMMNRNEAPVQTMDDEVTSIADSQTQATGPADMAAPPPEVAAPTAPTAPAASGNGLPHQLKAGMESLSGMRMDHVKVHYNSSQPAQLNALAYAQGTDIHVAPGQEQHLPHEAWHVVQQAQGRVQPTRQMKGNTPVNDDAGLEAEADVMGARAMSAGAQMTQLATAENRPAQAGLAELPTFSASTPVMRKIGFEYEVGSVNTEKDTAFFSTEWEPHSKGEIIKTRTGYDITADINQYGEGTNLEFITKPIDETSPAAAAELTMVANNIVADLTEIVQASYGPHADQDNWVTLDHLNRVNGKKSQRMHSTTNAVNNSLAQLQMTGGVDIHNLPDLMSGRVLGQEPLRAPMPHVGPQVSTEVKRTSLSKYYATNPAGEAKQPIYVQALSQINARFGDDWDVPSKQIIAAACALMAQIPIEKRANAELFMAGSGLLLAKTDYGTILHMATEAVGKTIDSSKFTNALVATINAHVPGDKQVSSASDVFPDDYSMIQRGRENEPDRGIVTFTGVKIGDWVTQAMPFKLPDLPLFPFGGDAMMQGMPTSETLRKGKDLLTAQNFPGTKAQKKEMRAFGTFGSKTDPGNKIILEWRSLGPCYPDSLLDAMLNALAYNQRL